MCLDLIGCRVLGVDDGGAMRDRVFMVVSPEGQFVTARAQPKLVLLQPRFEGQRMILSAPGQPEITIDVEALRRDGPLGTTSVWQQEVQSIDCGDEVAKWLSQYVCGEDVGLRLSFYPQSHATRPVRPKNVPFKTLTAVDSGALHDVSSFMLINAASVSDLNGRLDHEVTPLQFRPNFVVQGPEAFAEDGWKWVRIGDSVVFRNVKPCFRCIFTNIDPKTALRHKEQEPMRTLKGYRTIVPDYPPGMGVHLGVREQGIVKLGDEVFVEDE